jgi:phosphotransacetylase/acyl dehydratase
MQASDCLENVPFDTLRLGQAATATHTVSQEDVELVARISGDVNPTHIDPGYGAGHGGLVAHRVLANLLVSGVLGRDLPGPGTSYRSQTLTWSAERSIQVGDTLTTQVVVTALEAGDPPTVQLGTSVTNQDGVVVAVGRATVEAPTETIRLPCVALPEVRMIRHAGQQALLEQAKALDPVAVAVVYPADRDSLQGAVDAARLGLIVPVLVGPTDLMERLAADLRVDLSDFEIVEAPDGRTAAGLAVALVRTGKALALMKGSLHTDELMAAVVRRDTGLRTSRRISHCFVMHPPSYHKALIVTDAAINIAPDVEAKADICQNAIALAQALGTSEPKVAILSAVETINPKMQSTLDAATLCKMADRGQITGGMLDGPLAFDNAISAEAARTKGIKSAVAGDPDILLVPNLEAGNMVAKQLSFLADSDAAGIVLGAAVPIILTSRSDSVATRLASCAVGAILARAGGSR